MYLHSISLSDILLYKLLIWDGSFVRIFKTKFFNRWANKINLRDGALLQAIEQMQQGQYEAGLGGFLYKKRIAIDGKGKRGSLRSIVAFKKEDKAFFVYGYAKNSIENITEAELEALKELAKIYFSYSTTSINNAVKSKKFIEVTNNE